LLCREGGTNASGGVLWGGAAPLILGSSTELVPGDLADRTVHRPVNAPIRHNRAGIEKGLETARARFVCRARSPREAQNSTKNYFLIETSPAIRESTHRLDVRSGRRVADGLRRFLTDEPRARFDMRIGRLVQGRTVVVLKALARASAHARVFLLATSDSV
jgi:hypothetical protein